MQSEHDTITALNALQHIAADERLLTLFLQQTGMTPDTLRAQAAEPDFQAGVIDFILSDDAIALDFCAAFDLRPESLMQIRRRLPGASLESY